MDHHDNRYISTHVLSHRWIWIHKNIHLQSTHVLKSCTLKQEPLFESWPPFIPSCKFGSQRNLAFWNSSPRSPRWACNIFDAARHGPDMSRPGSNLHLKDSNNIPTVVRTLHRELWTNSLKYSRISAPLANLNNYVTNCQTYWQTSKIQKKTRESSGFYLNFLYNTHLPNYWFNRIGETNTYEWPQTPGITWFTGSCKPSGFLWTEFRSTRLFKFFQIYR